ncbi:MAG: adenine deaminase [Desulfobacterales bacterium]
MDLSALIAAARGDRPVDQLFENARLVNVYSGEIESRHIAVADGCIAGFGDYEARERIDLANRYVLPGFIDAHVHIESSMTAVSEFTRAVLPLGTTTVIADPHEIANVLGIAGLEYMLKEGKKQPMNVFFTLPSCVPATAMETAGANLDAKALTPFMSSPQVPALGEMMNFPGVIHGDPQVLEKLALARKAGKPADGHAPGLSGKSLNAYLSAGISSDHECTTLEEAREKLAAGMHIMIREGTAAKNLYQLLPLVNPLNAQQVMWCTDDRHPEDICEHGHINDMVRRAIQAGLSPVLAIRMATLNPARYFKLPGIGAIAPGMRADMVITPDLNALVPEQVYAAGELAAEDGQMHSDIQIPPALPCPSAMRVDLDRLDFAIPGHGQKVRVLEIVPEQIITRQQILSVKLENGLAVADPESDILKIAVVERHQATGNIGKGFVKGFGLKKGALASSVAHDSHNIVVVGTNDADMRAAVRHVVDMGGALCAVCEQSVKASLALPIAGLMATESLDVVRDQMAQLIGAAHDLGSNLSDPFMTLSFLALPVIPELKITDKGLFDVGQFRHVPVFVD